jgi:hypothetical protein
MDGDLMRSVIDAHRAVHDGGAHHLANQPPWHRVGIAIDLDRAIALRTPDELTHSLERWYPGDRFKRLCFGMLEPIDRCLAGRAMYAHIGDVPRPGLKVRLEGFAAREAAAGDRVSLHVADAVLGLALGAARYGAQARGRKPQCFANAFSFSLNTTVRVVGSCSTTKARALSNKTSSSTPPNLAKALSNPSN